jgi:tetratricopeptide (TPR) repeat protein
MYTLFVMVALAASPLDATFSFEERAVMAELDGDHLIKARDLAEKLLAAEPNSFVGAWAMTRVHHDVEGNHPRALAWSRRARKLLKQRDADWDKKVLLEEHFILAEMNRSQEALDVLEVYESLHGAPPSYLRVWPLIKLEKFEEARALASKLASSADWDDRIEGYNGLLTVEFEQHRREGTYKWSMEAVRASEERNCTILRNAAGAAFTYLRFDEAIELAIRSRKPKGCVDPVETQLAALHLVTGQFQQAVSALEAARGRKMERRFRPHFALIRRAVLTDLVEALGKPEEAYRLAEDLYRQQQRMGLSSSSPTVERLGRTLRYAFTLETRLYHLQEQASYSAYPVGPTAQTKDVASLTALRWEVRRALLTLVSDPGRLVYLARPNLGEAADWPSWRMGDLIPLVGSGVMRAAIAHARREDASTPDATGYLDALEAEVAWRERDWKEAETLGSKALAGLPRVAALWRWRIEAFRADALWRLGRKEEAKNEYQEVMQQWPPVFRMLDIAMPVAVEDDGTALAKTVRGRLERSTRFDVEKSAPFRLSVTSAGKNVDVCLTDATGARFGCGGADDANKALDDFHATAFAAKVSLTQSDLKSLDGSPVRVGADQALQNLLTP